MSKVSIIIASRNEISPAEGGMTVLQRMIKDIYDKATGDFEVLVTLDGPEFQTLPNYPNLTVIKNMESIGLKPSLNIMADLAKGKYILKLDSHCMMSYGINEVLQEKMEDNWIVTPRFYNLNSNEWKVDGERFWDYFHLHCPFTDPDQFKFKAAGHWRRRTIERLDIPFDETMQIHGSCWFLTRDYYLNCLGGMSSTGYDTFGMEPPELCLKTWLGPWDGKVMVNKKAWYAHMHKKDPRGKFGWPLSRERIYSSYDWTAKYWMGNKWEDRVHDLEWLVEKFWPVPTWPDNWRELWVEWKKENG